MPHLSDVLWVYGCGWCHIDDLPNRLCFVCSEAFSRGDHQAPNVVGKMQLGCINDFVTLQIKKYIYV